MKGSSLEMSNASAVSGDVIEQEVGDKPLPEVRFALGSIFGEKSVLPRMLSFSTQLLRCSVVYIHRILHDNVHGNPSEEEN